jgi:hypothetical protein
MSKKNWKQSPNVAGSCHWFVRAFAALVMLAPLVSCNDSPTGPTTGSLVVTITGLPNVAQNAVSVSGPTGSGFSRVLSATDTLRNLVPGSYTILANATSTSSGSYAPTVASQQVEIAASAAPAVASVQYQITTGSIAIAVNGLPSGTSASISLSGPAGFHQDITQSTTVTNLVPGAYSLTNSSVQAASGHFYSPSPLTTALTVLASETPRSVTTTYTLSTGTLEVIVTGLPQNSAADVTVTGPGGFSRQLTATTTIAGLYPGSYSISALDVLASGTAYSPSPATQPVQLAPSLTPVQSTVTYTESNAPPPPDFNLSIDGMYITQAVQDYGGGVPLVADMNGLLRVFVKASVANTVHPTVRAQFYNGATLVETIIVQPGSAGVPVSIAEGNFSTSWNASVPARLIQPGLRVQVDVDPSNAVIETNEGDNTFPVNGVPLDVRVEVTTPLDLTFVPVFQPATGLTGNITSQNLDQFMAFARKVVPIKDYQITLHAPFSTSAPPLESNDGNGGWFQVLGEINALRVAEGSPGYYMGIVGTPYSSGVAGFAFAPGRAAVSWDRLPNATSIVAHELSHNLSRQHAPCGGPANVDPEYPYPSGIIGVYGYDAATGQLKVPSTSDLMGYCGFGWISDYNYKGILNYRLTTPGAAVSPDASASRLPRGMAPTTRETFVQSNGVRHTLVVWGRIVDGQPVLEPGFAATTRPVLPARDGPYRIEALASNGRVIFSHAFEGEEPADVLDREVRQFAFAIPMDAAMAQSIATLRLTSETGARSEQTVNAGAVPAAASLEATVTGPGEVTFRVRDAGVRLAVVRERTTQRIIAFVRGQGPSVKVHSRAADFDVQLSDGVRSTARSLRAIRPR